MNLKFHQVVGKSEVHEAKSKGNEIYSNNNDCPDYAPYVSALGNEVMKTGKHYVTFKRVGSSYVLPPSEEGVGVIRPIDLSNVDLKQGEEGREDFLPWDKRYYPSLADENKTDGWGTDGKVDYCFFHPNTGWCFHGYWNDPSPPESMEDAALKEWPGMERINMLSAMGMTADECGLLLDLDEGTLSVYKSGKRLGVMMEGLTGEYCWFASVFGTGLRMERGIVPDDA